MSNILNFIRPDKRYENVQANRIAFFRMDDSFAEFIAKVEAEEFVILGIEWNVDDPGKLAFVLSHEKFNEPVIVPVVEPPVVTETLPEPRPSYAQRVEQHIREEVNQISEKH